MLKDINLKLSLPEELILSIGLPKEKLAKEIKKTYIIQLFNRGIISSGKAGEILGIGKEGFIDLLNDEGFSYYSYSNKEWIEEAKTIEEISGKVKT